MKAESKSMHSTGSFCDAPVASTRIPRAADGSDTLPANLTRNKRATSRVAMAVSALSRTYGAAWANVASAVMPLVSTPECAQAIALMSIFSWISRSYSMLSDARF